MTPYIILIAAKNSCIYFRNEESSRGSIYFVATDFNPLKKMTKNLKSSIGTTHLAIYDSKFDSKNVI
jgi:hypothetical protein